MRVYKKWFVRSHQFSILRNMTFYYMLKLFLKVQTVQIKMQEWYVDSMQNLVPYIIRLKSSKKKSIFPFLVYIQISRKIFLLKKSRRSYQNMYSASNLVMSFLKEIPRSYIDRHQTPQTGYYFITRCPFDIGLSSLTVRFQTL